MTPVSLIFAYYENAGMLKEQFRNIRELPAKVRDLLRVVVVDDGSPDNPAVAEEIGCPLQVYRVDIDVRWNQDACRNIGVHHAETNWLLLTDIDHVVPHRTWQRVVFGNYDPAVVCTFRRVSAPDLTPYHPHPNSWLMTRKVFERIGGYDERFAGYYGTDADFRERLGAVAPILPMKDVIIRYPRDVIHDASTTRYLRKQPEDRENIARILRDRGREENWTTKRLSFPYHRVA